MRCSGWLCRAAALHDQWRPVLWAIAILTMTVGTVTAVNQINVKRMLAIHRSRVGFAPGVIAVSGR